MTPEDFSIAISVVVVTLIALCAVYLNRGPRA